MPGCSTLSTLTCAQGNSSQQREQKPSLGFHLYTPKLRTLPWAPLVTWGSAEGKGSSHSNLTQSLNCLPTHLFSHFLIHSVIHSFTYAFTHSHSNSLIHLTHLFLPSFILFFTPSFIHSVTHSFIYSLICSFIHPLTL